MEMLNYIWGGMILISLVVSVFTGRVEQTAAAAVDGAASAVENCISLLGIMCFWTGIAKIGERAGTVKIFSRVLRPVTRRIFPRLKEGGAAMNAIVLNIIANILGMGNAATPLGIKAVKELNKLNRNGRAATNEMCMFVVLNTASVQLIPTTVISMRAAWGSQTPGEVIVPIWIVSFCALTVGIVVTKLLEGRNSR